MPGYSQRSRAAAAATPPSSHLVEDISQGISTLSLSGPQPSDQRSLWFIPDNLDPVPCIQKGPSHGKRKPLNHVPRPRNAFIVFRSHLLDQKVLPASVEFCQNSRHVSRIASQVWKVLPDEDKERFYHLGDEEKLLHQQRFPSYKITARKGKTKYRSRYSPVNESNLTPEQTACKRIAELVLKNIQGDELETQIQDVVKATLHSGWLEPASIPTLSRTTSPGDGDMDVDAIAPTSRATKVQKSNKGRTNKSRSAPKIRSSTSKKRQSKATLKMQPRRTIAVNRATPFSDDGWGEIDDPNQTSSEAGLPPPSVTTGSVSTDSFDSSMDTIVDTPSRFVSPSIVGDAAGDFDWDADVTAQTRPFDQEVSFEPYKDPRESVVAEGSIYAAFGIHYPRGLYDYHTPEQSTYHGFQHGCHYGTTQAVMGEALFTTNFVVAVPEPQTISPQCLL